MFADPFLGFFEVYDLVTAQEHICWKILPIMKQLLIVTAYKVIYKTFYVVRVLKRTFRVQKKTLHSC